MSIIHKKTVSDSAFHQEWDFHVNLITVSSIDGVLCVFCLLLFSNLKKKIRERFSQAASKNCLVSDGSKLVICQGARVELSAKNLKVMDQMPPSAPRYAVISSPPCSALWYSGLFIAPEQSRFLLI